MATLSSVTWTTPKTDWTSTDKFNIEDFNRIKNNLEYLHWLAERHYAEFDIEDMGDDITSYADYWDVDKFNAIESNLETINKNIFLLEQDIGDTQTFYENGLFIQYDELNRIESAIIDIKDVFGNISIYRLSFRLGTYRGIQV